MRVIGIDPGTATTGFGILDIEDDKAVFAFDWGLIETSKDGSPESRLVKIHEDLIEKITLYKPDILAIERVFFATNAKTAISVGQAIGVMMLSAAKMNIPIREYAPGTIKKMVAGTGRADKKVIQRAVRKILGAKVKSEAHKKTHFDNAADALAVALCHLMKENLTPIGVAE